MRTPEDGVGQPTLNQQRSVANRIRRIPIPIARMASRTVAPAAMRLRRDSRLDGADGYRRREEDIGKKAHKGIEEYEPVVLHEDE